MSNYDISYISAHIQIPALTQVPLVTCKMSHVSLKTHWFSWTVGVWFTGANCPFSCVNKAPDLVGANLIFFTKNPVTLKQLWSVGVGTPEIYLCKSDAFEFSVHPIFRFKRQFGYWLISCVTPAQKWFNILIDWWTIFRRLLQRMDPLLGRFFHTSFIWSNYYI